MGILLWIIFGGIIGWVAPLIMNTDQEQEALLYVIIGVVGAVVGGWLISFFGESGIIGFNLYNFVVALIGAIMLIVVTKALRIVQ